MEKTRKETGLKRLMFNYIKLLFCAVVSVALFYGCDNNDDNIIPGKPPKKLENAYISNYVIVDQLRYFYMSDTYDSIPTDPHIQFWLVGRSCSDDELEKLSREYGDTAYNGNKIRSYFVGPVVSDSIKKIDVTCRSDYDAQHPKGTSLADIVLFCGHSYYDFIRNGYTVVDAEKNKPENENLCKFVEARWSPSDDNDIADPWATVVSDTLKNISYADTKLLNARKTVLWFTKRPEGHGTFWFDLTVVMSSGLKFSVPVTYQYDR